MEEIMGKWNEPPAITSKAGLHTKAAMLCICWDWKGILHYELLLENQMINSNKYCSKLDQQKWWKCLEFVNRKHRNFHQDTSRPYVSLMIRQKLLQLSSEVLIHLPYSPDIAPSDFHLLSSLQNSCNGKIFSSLEDCKKQLEKLFTPKGKTF